VTRSRSSRGRNGPRVGRPKPDVVQDGATVQVESETMIPAETGTLPHEEQPLPGDQPNELGPSHNRRQSSNGGSRSGSPGRNAQRGPADNSRSRNSSGQGRTQRRRQQRRPQPLAMPNEILKGKAPVTLTLRPVEKRRVEEISGENGPIFGCPMLTRTRIALPVFGNHQAPRCSLGWALRTEDEALLCMNTEDVPACWKAHPENVEEIRSRMLERETAAD